MENKYMNQGTLNPNDWVQISIDDEKKGNKASQLGFDPNDLYGRLTIEIDLLKKIIEITEGPKVVLDLNAYVKEQHGFISLILPRKFINAVLKKHSDTSPEEENQVQQIKDEDVPF